MTNAVTRSDAVAAAPEAASAKRAVWPGMQLALQAFDYWTDTWQRSVLFLDVLRQRGNNFFERAAEQVPNVLRFRFELIMNGRDLPRPVNYGLVWILPPPNIKINPQRHPFIIFDPCAGQGPGINGMKHDSEIGVALANGHPCHFIGFLPDPVPGQTVEDVCLAEAAFVEKVGEMHSEADGKPCMIGNCQAGWQIMMMSAIRPDLVGPIILAGELLSYWAGVHGKNPMRYLGGVLGGTWLTSLAGDLGNGIFDGVYCIENFENLSPANTFWKRNYNVYSKVDTEAPRFLEFEKWWGNPVLLNAAEMQYIADELFVGNKLASGEICASDGRRIDLRNIKTPIVVFCFWNDNITPPQQALDWILDLYESEKEIAANGQTIIYALHQTIGHLGIFVSAKVATKEHEEFARTIDLIDVLPPGLYEAVITEKEPEKTARPELVSGNYLVRFEVRTLDDIRALGGNDAADDLGFATLARVSEINQGLYRTLASPAIRSIVNDQTADRLRQMHRHRIRYEIFSDENLALRQLGELAETIRANRRPVGAENPLLAMEEALSQQIVQALDSYRDVRDWFTETLFMTVYGSLILQAMVGLGSDNVKVRRHIGREAIREAAAQRMVAEIEARVDRGGLCEAVVRALLYVRLGLAVPAADERAFAVLRQIRAEHPETRRLTLAHFKECVKEQDLMLRIDQERAIAAVPILLPPDGAERDTALRVIHRVASAAGEPTGESKTRLARIETYSQPRRRPTVSRGRSLRLLEKRRRAVQRGQNERPRTPQA